MILAIASLVVGVVALPAFASSGGSNLPSLLHELLGGGDDGNGDPGNGDPGNGDPGNGDPGNGGGGNGDPGNGGGGNGDPGNGGGDGEPDDNTDDGPGNGGPGNGGGGGGGGGGDGGDGGDGDGDGGDGDGAGGGAGGGGTETDDDQVTVAPRRTVPDPVPDPVPAHGEAGLRQSAPRQCVSRRAFRIRVREYSYRRLRSAQVWVNGKLVKTVRQDRLRAAVDLRGLPKGRFTVKITAVTTRGNKVSGARRYRTCTPKEVRQYKGRW